MFRWCGRLCCTLCYMFLGKLSWKCALIIHLDLTYVSVPWRVLESKLLCICVRYLLPYVLQPYPSWPACTLVLTFVSFCSVGLGSYLRAHNCHSYPGPLSCRSHLISLSLVSLPWCSRFVRLGLCLFVSLINVVRPNLFPLSIVMSGEYVVVLFVLNIGAQRGARPTTLRSHAQSSSTAIRLVYVNLVSSMSFSSRLQPRFVYVNLVSSSVILVSSPTSSRLCQPGLVHVSLVSSMSISSRPSHAGQLFSSFLSFFFIRPSSSNLFSVYFILWFFVVVCVSRGCPSSISGIRWWVTLFYSCRIRAQIAQIVLINCSTNFIKRLVEFETRMLSHK